VTLKELLDFAFELLEPSQSSQTDEDETSSESVAELLSSPQATSTAATKATIKNFFKAIKFTPTKYDKYRQNKLPEHFREQPILTKDHT
jgi:hypothetical protein